MQVASPLLQVEQLVSCYGLIRAISGINLHVSAGELVTLIGANGAGKTTFLRAVSGLNRVESGRVCFAGKNITNVAPDRIVGMGIAHIPQGKQLFGDMSVSQNLRLGAFLRIRRGTPSAEIAGDIENLVSLFPVLGNRLRQKAGTLSGGEQGMLAIARALMSRPKMLLLDEPSLGIAPKIVDTIFDALLRLSAERGMAMLLVEQNAARALEIASRAYVLKIGKLLLEGDAKQLRSDPQVLRLYLGGHSRDQNTSKIA